MKNVKTMYRKLTMMVVLGVLLAVMSCNNLLTPPKGNSTDRDSGSGNVSEDGKVLITIKLFTGSARMVMPDIEQLDWHITAKQGTDNIEATGTYPTYTLELPTTGPWTFTVKGTKENKELFTGTVTENVSNSTTSISIPLSPGSGMTDGGATGTLSLPIELINVCYMNLTYRINDGENDGEWVKVEFEGSGKVSIFKNDLSVGQHTLDLYFGEGSKFYFCTVAVNIWPEMTSDRWIKTNGEEYINDNGEFVITEEMVNEFVKTMGSVVFVDASVNTDEPATGSIFAPVNSVSKAVDILRKANEGNTQIKGTIMVSGATEIESEIQVLSDETLTVKGTEAGASIKNTSGRVFNIISGGSLTLGENITLTGTNDTGNGGAVYVNGGTFTMKADSKITGSSASYGGGVYMASGTFNMTGTAVIQGNEATGGSSHACGGGVYVNGGNFTMNGTASMEDNKATGTYGHAGGGGVYVNGTGKFDMAETAIIQKNNASTTDLNSAAGGGGVYVINGGKFTMTDNAIIQDNEVITVQNDACGGGVYVIDSGTFTMNGTAIIQDNKATGTNGHACGGGVYVNGTGKFDMADTAIIQRNNANTIDTNSAAGGGGVYVNGGTFTMTGTAKIQGNTTTSMDSVKTPSGGGGVFVIAGGTFTMSGGTIGGTDANEADLGGGVYVGVNTDTSEKGSFTIGGGTITGNTATQNGGGVYVAGGTFTMSDTATIQDNTATTHGGGVHIFSGGTFTMNGGTIGGTAQNTAEYGGGVFVSGGIFNMNDGTISGNTVTQSGGGVYVNDGNFTMAGGTIGGTTANTATQNGGGVHVFGGTFTVSGSRLTITGNTAHNVYLANGKTISIGADGLTGGTIGVTAEGIGAGRKVKITNTSVDRAGVIFISDYAAYSIAEYDGAVYLSDAETKYVAGADGTETLGLFKDALAAVNASGGTITLLKNIDGTNAVFGTSNNTLITFTGGTETKPIILDLNGKTINRGLGVAQADGSVIRIEGGTLTIKDSSATNPDGTNGIGTITGGNTNDGGGGIHITSNSIGPVPGSLILESGSISDNTANASFGGGVYIGNDCTFTMNGGAIENNKVISNSGGGVYVGSSTFIMTGGNITGNTVTEHGGGVNIGSNGVFTMSNGTISGNTATQNGGGVYVSNSGSFEIGISTAVSSPVVSGNAKADSSPNNVYLDGTILLIDGKLEKTVGPGNIGVSMATTGEKFTYQWDRSGLIDTTFFFSDDTKRTVALSGSELSLNLVRVEGGSCTLNGINVTLSSFWISPYEVTQAEFKSIMTGNTNGIASNPSYFPDNPAAGEVQKRRPADRVRWFEAIVYCNLLSIKEGLTPCYTIKGSTDPADWGVRPDSQIHENYNCWNSVTCDFEADGYRLPTETEWEYAARGGQTGISDSSWNNIYSGSTTLEDVAWYSSNSESKTHEVGKKQANALGLYDMSGNLNEWCWNRKSEGNDSRVMRGGYYSSAEGGCQVTAFDSNWPISQGPDQGFRVVRSIR